VACKDMNREQLLKSRLYRLAWTALNSTHLTPWNNRYSRRNYWQNDQRKRFCKYIILRQLTFRIDGMCKSQLWRRFWFGKPRLFINTNSKASSWLHKVVSLIEKIRQKRLKYNDFFSSFDFTAQVVL
jgi:hypothetical protein